MARDDAHAALEYELAREKAGTLTRITAKLEEALRALEGAPADVHRAQLVGEAARWLWYVVVQREAMGLTNHDIVFETYRVPQEVRTRAGCVSTPHG